MSTHCTKRFSTASWKRPFFIIWFGQAFSILGSQLVQFVLIWWLTKTTGSATVLATATLVGLTPQVFLGPLAGAIVDRWNRRLTMILADATVAMAVVGLMILFALDRVQIWHIYLLMFLRDAAGTFHWTAMQASTSLMVPKQHLSRLQGLNMLLRGGLNIVSAPLGALLLAFLPMQGILAIDVSTACLAILPLCFIVIPQPNRSQVLAADSIKPSLWQDVKAGLRYVISWPGLMIICIMATLINLVLAPAFSLLPILVTEHFGGQALELGWIESAFGIGMVLGSSLLSIWGGFKRRVLTSLLSLTALGFATLTIGLAPASAFWLALCAMLLAGLMQPLVNGPILAILQAVVDAEMQGRVLSLVGSGTAAMTPLGLLVAGPIADALGVNVWFIAGGILTIVMSLAGFFIPAVFNIEKGRSQSKGIFPLPSYQDSAKA